MTFGKFFGALRAHLNKIASLLFVKSDPIQVMQLEVDQVTERLKEGRKGLEMYRDVACQVAAAKTTAAQLDAQIEAHLKAGNRDVAEQLAEQLQKAQTDLAANEGQLQMHDGAYQNNLLKLQKANRDMIEVSEKIQKHYAQLKMSAAEAEISQIAETFDDDIASDFGQPPLLRYGALLVESIIQRQIDANLGKARVAVHMSSRAIETNKADDRTLFAREYLETTRVCSDTIAAKVYAYHDPQVGMTDPRLVDLFRENWEKHGFEVSILGPDDAAAHPRFSELLERVRNFPTQNNSHYEVSCFLRWLAMALCGGLHVDTDVLSNGFRPKHIAELFAANMQDWLLVTSGWSGTKIGDLYVGENVNLLSRYQRPTHGDIVLPLCLESSYVPCALAGTREQYEALIDLVLAEPVAPEHTSDMTIFIKHGPAKAMKLRLCSQPFREPAWRDYPLIHFSTASVLQLGRPPGDKVAVMKENMPNNEIRSK